MCALLKSSGCCGPSTKQSFVVLRRGLREPLILCTSSCPFKALWKRLNLSGKQSHSKWVMNGKVALYSFNFFSISALRHIQATVSASYCCTYVFLQGTEAIETSEAAIPCVAWEILKALVRSFLSPGSLARG